MQEWKNNVVSELSSIFEHVSSEVSLLHSSRATPALVENISVVAYGGTLPLKQVAALSTPDSRTIVVQPWDPALLGDIQKAIQTSHVGLSSAVEEKIIRLTMPQLSEERRKEMTKLLGKKIEEGRISVRRVRDHAIKSFEEAEKNKFISQDEKFRSKDAVQKIIDDYINKLSNLERKKSEEIML